MKNLPLTPVALTVGLLTASVEAQESPSVFPVPNYCSAIGNSVKTVILCPEGSYPFSMPKAELISQGDISDTIGERFGIVEGQAIVIDTNFNNISDTYIKKVDGIIETGGVYGYGIIEQGFDCYEIPPVTSGESALIECRGDTILPGTQLITQGYESSAIEFNNGEIDVYSGNMTVSSTQQ